LVTKILITGGAGFIGTHLTQVALQRGHQVRILDNLSEQVHGSSAAFVPQPGAEFIRGDITIRSDMERALDGIDTVVHLAAETGTGQSMYEIARYYQVNVQGTAVLFDILANGNGSVRNFILASSRSVYGEGAYICRGCDPAGARRFPPPRTACQLARQQWTPACPECGHRVEPCATHEDDPLAPASIYAATKVAQENLVRVACRALGIPNVILRFQNVFGEGQALGNPYTGILSIFSTRIRLGQSLPIFEDGQETRDFVHVEDVAGAIVRCIEQPGPGGLTLNVGSGKPTSIMAIARMLQKNMSSTIEPHVTGEYRIGDIRHNFADISRLQSAKNYRPAISVEAGMKRFSEWVAKQPIPQDLLDRANEELRARKLMA
jgi:dTDP-L-rhamnose 4-epimerase